jgi:ABC-type glycerol-3-phosphate transport system substrate-binding protein
MLITIHSSANYTAHLMTSGLIIESTRKAGGVQLRHNHPQFNEYVDALRTAIDNKEGDALCRALLN